MTHYYLIPHYRIPVVCYSVPRLDRVRYIDRVKHQLMLLFFTHIGWDVWHEFCLVVTSESNSILNRGPQRDVFSIPLERYYSGFV